MTVPKKAPSDWFEKRIAELIKTAQHLKSMQDNGLVPTRIRVGRVKVEAHFRGAHDRIVYRKRKSIAGRRIGGAK